MTKYSKNSFSKRILMVHKQTKKVLWKVLAIRAGNLIVLYLPEPQFGSRYYLSFVLLSLAGAKMFK